MKDAPSLTPEVGLDLVRAAWYSHDARWFNAVAEEFGMEAANRANLRAVRALAAAEARRLGRVLGIEACADLPAFLDFLEAGRAVYVPASMIEMSVTQLDEQSYEVDVTRCFVAENITRAGIADSYTCAVFQRVEGWHEAMGLPVGAATAGLPCALAAGIECRRRIAVGKPASTPCGEEGASGLESEPQMKLRLER